MLRGGSVIKGDIFADWKTVAMRRASKFRQHVVHVKLFQAGVYFSVPEIMIYVYAFHYYGCVRRQRSFRWRGPHNKIAPSSTSNPELTLDLVIVIMCLLQLVLPVHKFQTKIILWLCTKITYWNGLSTKGAFDLNQAVGVSLSTRISNKPVWWCPFPVMLHEQNNACKLTVFTSMSIWNPVLSTAVSWWWCLWR